MILFTLSYFSTLSSSCFLNFGFSFSYKFFIFNYIIRVSSCLVCIKPFLHIYQLTHWLSVLYKQLQYWKVVVYTRQFLLNSSELTHKNVSSRLDISLVALAGFEPTTSRLWALRAGHCSTALFKKRWGGQHWNVVRCLCLYCLSYFNANDHDPRGYDVLVFQP